MAKAEPPRCLVGPKSFVVFKAGDSLRSAQVLLHKARVSETKCEARDLARQAVFRLGIAQGNINLLDTDSPRWSSLSAGVRRLGDRIGAFLDKMDTYSHACRREGKRLW